MTNPEEIGCRKLDDKKRTDMFLVVDFDKFYEAMLEQKAELPDNYGEMVTVSLDSVYPCTGDGGFYMGHGAYSVRNMSQDTSEFSEEKDRIRWALF